jgi:voltage-gated potassium channel
MAIQTPKQQAYSLFILFISIFSILLIGIITLIPISPESLKIIEFLDYVICVIFFVDFLISFIRAESKRRYFFTWGWFDLLSSIPAVYFLRWFRFARILRIGRVLRGARAGKIMASFLMGNRAQGGIIGALLMAVLLIFIGSISILQLEQVPGGNINSAEDAIWWSVTTMTTVGLGDKYPVTTEGKFISAVLMFAGIGLFGVVSGFIASWFIAPSSKEGEKERSEIKNDVAILQSKIDSLDSKVEEIIGYLKEKEHVNR